jgi:uncharacterized protein YwgA
MAEVLNKEEGKILLLAIIDSFWKHHNPDDYLGRTHIQKIPYFVKVLGVPLPFHYEILHYGPFSTDIAYLMEELLSEELITDRSRRKPRYSNFKLTKRGLGLLKKNQHVITRYQDHINKVVNLLQNLGPSSLELISTLHFLHWEQKIVKTEEPIKIRVINRFKQLKNNKFPDKLIKKAYNAIEEVGLLVT